MEIGSGDVAATSSAGPASFSTSHPDKYDPDPWAHWHSLTPQDTFFGDKTAEYYSWKYTRDARLQQQTVKLLGAAQPVELGSR
eukprot:12909095-Prorocentrum_lima.AAC.1